MFRIFIFQDLEKESFLYQRQFRRYLNQLLMDFFFDVPLIATVKDSHDFYLVDLYTLYLSRIVSFFKELINMFTTEGCLETRFLSNYVFRSCIFQKT